MDFFDEPQSEEPTALLTSQRTSKQKRTEPEEGCLTVDVYQTDDEIVIRSTVAGVNRDDMDISVSNDMVTIKGTRRPSEKVRPSDYYYQELHWGPFSRSVILPEDVDADNAKATMDNGIFTLHLPKLAKTKIKKIKISL